MAIFRRVSSNPRHCHSHQSFITRIPLNYRRLWPICIPFVVLLLTRLLALNLKTVLALGRGLTFTLLIWNLRYCVFNIKSIVYNKRNRATMNINKHNTELWRPAMFSIGRMFESCRCYYNFVQHFTTFIISWVSLVWLLHVKRLDCERRESISAVTEYIPDVIMN